MRKYERTSVFRRDLLGRGGKQYILPWGPGKTISTIQAAERLGMSHDTVRRMCEAGEIQGWQLRPMKGSPWRVSIESIDDHIAKTIATHDISDPDVKAPQSTARAERNASALGSAPLPHSLAP